MESSSLLLESAAGCRSQKDYTKAISLFTQYITDCLNTPSKCSSPSLAAAYNEQGFTKYLYVDFEGAVEDYTKAIDLQESAVYYYNRGLVHYRLARFKQAVDDTSQALRLRPDFPDALSCLQQARVDGKL